MVGYAVLRTLSQTQCSTASPAMIKLPETFQTRQHQFLRYGFNMSVLGKLFKNQTKRSCGAGDQKAVHTGDQAPRSGTPGTGTKAAPLLLDRKCPPVPQILSPPRQNLQAGLQRLMGEF